MAEEVQIAGAGSLAKVRNPLGVIGLSLITLGIYFFFWWYFINREMRDLGRARGVDLGQSPGNSVLAITLGALVIVPAIVSEWRTCARIQASEEAVGLESRASGPVIFILFVLIAPVGLWYAQSELNKVWRAQQSGGASQSTLQMPQPEAPPSQPAPAPPAPPAGPEVPGQ
jgi:hypothetical protein